MILFTSHQLIMRRELLLYRLWETEKKMLKLKSQTRLYMTIQEILSQLMLAISQNKSGLRKLHQHLSLENIHQRRLLTEEIFCKLQLVMCHIFLTEMPIMIKLENKVKKREDQLKLVTTHFTNLQLIMKRELLSHKLDQIKW
jgi:hypothetical protein